MNWRRVGIILFVVALLVLSAGVLSNLIAYGEMLEGNRDVVSTLWDFDGMDSEEPFVPWDWSFYPGVFNVIGVVLAVLASVLYWGSEK